ncbi:hypothetical protein JIQ42_03756 [Leishmania sp. Namibia]|uniref:hypothetical protein n=1 Tax=Leishmania sp. Namibia TaxID=2802991 RepID=UPI001B578AB6|nr:hypothetical protein JIQ42_03756 [Leishmania sp. Namibia]
MLTSAEEAYTNYLERRVVADGVDAAIVRATLHQIGLDEEMVAVMMGDRSAYSSPFSTTSSASSNRSASISSVKKPSRASGLSAATSTPSAPSEMADIGHLRLVVTTPAESAVPTPTAAPATATRVTSEPRSAHHESKRRTSDASHPCTPSPDTAAAAGAALASSSFSSSTSSPPAPPRTVVADTVAGAAKGDGVNHCSSAVLSARSSAESSVCQMGAKGDGAVVVASGAPSSTPSEATTASIAGCAEFTAAERAILTRWMREYRALMRSSALPRRTSRSRAEVSSSAALLLPPGASADEFHAFPSAATCSVRAEDDDYGAASAILRDEIAGQPQFAQSKGGTGVSRKAEDSDFSSSGSDGATSSNCSAFICTDGGHPPYSSELVLQDGTDAAVKRQNGRSSRLSEHNHPSGVRSLNRAARAAASLPTRRAVPRLKSSTFVPTCGTFVPRRATGCIRCNFDAAQCRHPYREAQDARIARASHVAVKSNGEYDHRAVGQSCCQARQLDAARQAQQTARAQPTSGRRTPVMRPLIRTLVRPRAGLGSGRQSSTLPVKAKTDRVQLAQYYRHQWELQERRSSAAERSAAWDARYSLLCCAGWTE